jgi:multidrug efflux pump subunit AcrA (membrane-fusion protein)
MKTKASRIVALCHMNLPARHSLIPKDAVHTVGQLSMLKVVTDKTAQLRQVKLGRQVGDKVDVLAGLRAGDRIILPQE